MRFAFNDDQKMLRDTVREVLQRECPPDVVRSVWEGDETPATSVWATLADTGVIGMAASEGAGGMGMREVDSVLLFEELGYSALPGPFVDTMAVGIPLLETIGTEAQRTTWLDRLTTGAARAVVAWESQGIVAHSGAADVLLVRRDGRSYCVPWGDVRTVAQPSVDRARQTVSIELDVDETFRMQDDADSEAAWRLAEERATVATAAQLVGLSRRMLDLTVAYAKDRTQFGKPIGAQQAVKHRLADALIRQEFARPLVYRAAWSLATGQSTADVDVSLAKAAANDAAKFVAKQALQVHGAIGYTIEYDLHMWMKRAWALAAEHGDAAFHRARIARHVL